MAVGWRAVLADILERHGLHATLDAISAYAELRCRHDPDRCGLKDEMAAGNWAAWMAAKQPAQRRIDVLDLPLPDAKRAGRPRIYD